MPGPIWHRFARISTVTRCRVGQACGLEELGVGLWLPAQAAAELARGYRVRCRSFSRDRRLAPLHHQRISLRQFSPSRSSSIGSTNPPGLSRSGSITPASLPTSLAALLERASRRRSSARSARCRWVGRANCTRPSSSPGPAENLRAPCRPSRKDRSTNRAAALWWRSSQNPDASSIRTDDVIDWFSQQLPDDQASTIPDSVPRHLSLRGDDGTVRAMCWSDLPKPGSRSARSRSAMRSSPIGNRWPKAVGAKRSTSFASSPRIATCIKPVDCSRLVNSNWRKIFPICLVVAADNDLPMGDDRRWVVHFHVPIFLERFGRLATSQNEVLDCLQYLSSPSCEVRLHRAPGSRDLCVDRPPRSDATTRTCRRHRQRNQLAPQGIGAVRS